MGRALTAPLGPHGPGPCGPPWAPLGHLWAPWGLLGRALVESLWVPLGSLFGPGNCEHPPWALACRALVGQALVGTPGPLWAGRALVGRALVPPPWALMGQALIGPATIYRYKYIYVYI